MASAATQRHDAVAVALAVPDDELTRALRQLHVAAVKRGELADPQARPQQHLDDRAVP